MLPIDKFLPATEAEFESIQLISRPAVARLLGVTVRTLKRWEGKGLLSPIVINSRTVRYRWIQVKELIDNSSVNNRFPIADFKEE